MQERNFSFSHNRRQQVKKVPRRNPSLDANYPPREDEGADTEKAVTETVSESYQDTQSNEGADFNAITKNSNGADFGNSDLSVETKSRVRRVQKYVEKLDLLKLGMPCPTGHSCNRKILWL